MKIHSGERTFPCKFCSEAFTDKTSLTDHTTAQHANEKVPLLDFFIVLLIIIFIISLTCAVNAVFDL